MLRGLEGKLGTHRHGWDTFSNAVVPVPCCFHGIAVLVFLFCFHSRDVDGRPTMVLRSIAHHPGVIDPEDFKRYFIYLLEQVRNSDFAKVRTRYSNDTRSEINAFLPFASFVARARELEKNVLFLSRK